MKTRLVFAMLVLVVVMVPIVFVSATEPEPHYNETEAKGFDPEDLPWSNETDIIIAPPLLPPMLFNLNITPAEIELGDYIIISFVIKNADNQSYVYIATIQIGDLTLMIEIELESYESKTISYRIIPGIVGEYDVGVDGLTGTFKVVPITPEPITNETDVPVVINITDPLEELNLKIDYLVVNLQDLTREFFLLQTTYNVDMKELNLRIDSMEADFEGLEADLEDLTREFIVHSADVKILKERIVYTQIALLIMAVVMVTAVVIAWKKA